MSDSSTNDIDSEQANERIRDFQHVEKELRKKNIIMEEELRLAAEFQRAVLPDPVNLDYIESNVIYKPYTTVSGDVYDFLLNRERELGVFVGDVTGHGVAAALMTMMVQLALDTIRRDLSTEEYIRRLNQILSRRQTGRSVTGVFFRITPAGLLTVTHAAHPPLLIVPVNGGKVVKFEKGGCALGQFRDEPISYEEESFQLDRGDKIVAYTDAVIEWRNNDSEEFGLNRLIESLTQNRQATVQGMLDELMQDLEKHAGGLPCNDDMTVLLLEYTGTEK